MGLFTSKVNKIKDTLAKYTKYQSIKDTEFKKRICEIHNILIFHQYLIKIEGVIKYDYEEIFEKYVRNKTFFEKDAYLEKLIKIILDKKSQRNATENLATDFFLFNYSDFVIFKIERDFALKLEKKEIIEYIEKHTKRFVEDFNLILNS